MVREQYPVLELWPIRCQFDMDLAEPLFALGRTRARRALGTRMPECILLKNVINFVHLLIHCRHIAVVMVNVNVANVYVIHFMKEMSVKGAR
jgi:hypothetical protein